jgi:hypothetical protein
MLTCSFYLLTMQGSLEPAAAGRNGTNFSQCSTVWEGFPQARGSGSCSLILVDVLFLLDGGGKRQGKKIGERNRHGTGGFLGLDLACWQVTAVRCN